MEQREYSTRNVTLKTYWLEMVGKDRKTIWCLFDYRTTETHFQTAFWISGSKKLEFSRSVLYMVLNNGTAVGHNLASSLWDEVYEPSLYPTWEYQADPFRAVLLQFITEEANQ